MDTEERISNLEERLESLSKDLVTMGSILARSIRNVQTANLQRSARIQELEKRIKGLEEKTNDK